MQSKKQRLVVFSDFDGTIAINDLGDEIFKVFGDFDTWHEKLITGAADIKSYWHGLCKTFDKDVSEEDIEKLALSSEIDPYFKKFAEYCQSESLPLYIVSDGFSSYIKPILERENLAHIPFFSNKLIFSDRGISPTFPGASESCNCMSASCKRNKVLSHTVEDSIIVYIGDGYSDFCGAEHSDIIFAKKNLAAYCNEHKIPHYPFKNFFDVERTLRNIISSNKLKIRNDALMKRKRAFEME